MRQQQEVEAIRTDSSSSLGRFKNSNVIEMCILWES